MQRAMLVAALVIREAAARLCRPGNNASLFFVIGRLARLVFGDRIKHEATAILIGKTPPSPPRLP